LVLLDRHEVIAALLVEDLARRGYLSVGRITQDDFAHQVQLGQLLAPGGDFIAALAHQSRTQPAAATVHRAEGLHVGVADFLAVDDDQAVLHRPQDLLLPEQEHPLQQLRVHRREHPLKGGSFGRAHSARVRVPAEFERAQQSLGNVAA
jgi:hypothetical protein